MKKEKTKKQDVDTTEVKQEQPQNEAQEATKTATENTDTATAESEQKLEEYSAKCAELTEKCAELTDKNLRMMAEFDNYRKRTIKEKGDLIKSAGENIFVDMLPLIDDFERAQDAMKTSDDVKAVKEGIDIIYNKFIAFLTQKGVKAIDTENAEFNVAFHEAITTFPAPTEEQKGKIIDCVSKGYTLNDKVIRFSKVVVGE